MQAPFSLERADVIVARVTSINGDGASEASEVGGSAFIPIRPSQPINLQRNENDF